VGIEFDYLPGQEQPIAAMLDRYDVDYAIGSVHEVEGWDFNMGGWGDMRRSRDDLYRGYFDMVQQAAQSGLFQIIGHLDLIKMGGLRPKGDIVALAAGAVEAICEADLCVEINTNGLNVPAREFYPERALIEELAAHGAAFTLGSDAHGAERVGENLDKAADILRGLRVGQVYGFAQKERVAYSLV
jgi:histidinol-phosphatase (PHP family)